MRAIIGKAEIMNAQIVSDSRGRHVKSDDGFFFRNMPPGSVIEDNLFHRIVVRGVETKNPQNAPKPVTMVNQELSK